MNSNLSFNGYHNILHHYTILRHNTFPFAPVIISLLQPVTEAARVIKCRKRNARFTINQPASITSQYITSTNSFSFPHTHIMLFYHIHIDTLGWGLLFCPSRLWHVLGIQPTKATLPSERHPLLCHHI